MIPELEKVEEKNPMTELVKPVASANNETRKLITELYKINPEAAVSSIIVSIVDLIDLVWYDSPALGHAQIISDVFQLVGKRCETYDKMEREEAKRAEEIVQLTEETLENEETSVH